MPTEFTFEDATKPAAKEFTFEEANTFSFEDAAGTRDSSRDSYEAQVADLNLSPEDMAAAQATIDQRSDLLAQQSKAKAQGEYWQGVSDRIDKLTGNVVEPLSRPVSGAVGRAVDAVLPQGAKVVEQALQTPAINLPRAGEAQSPSGKVAAGIYNAAADLLAGFSSPDAVALLPAAANKTVLTAWISQMAGHQPERVLRAAEAFKAGKTQEAVQEVATGVGELGMAELGRRHVMGGDALKPSDVNGAPALRVNAAGEVVDMANPDLVARNLAAPGTVRPTEQRAMASPLEGRNPAEVVFERVPILNPAGEVVDVKVQPRIREIVIESPDVIEPVRRFLKPDVEGGKISFGAEAPTLNREALGPRIEPVTKEVIDNGQRQEEGRQTLLDQPERPAPTIEAPQSPGTESPAANVRKGTEMPAEAGATPAPESVPAMAAPERIVATAIRNPETGEVTSAPNKIHIQLFSDAGIKAARMSAKQVEEASGFLTDRGRFVSREEANAIAQQQGLISRGEDVMGEHVTGAQKAVNTPGIVSGTAAEAWADRTIQQARGRLNTGFDPELFAAWVVKGSAHVERGIRRFSDWSRKMLAEHGDAIRPHLRRVFEESQRAYQRTTADLGALKQRKLAARGSVSRDVAPEHRGRLKTGAESFYEPQDTGRVEDLVSRMTADELASVPLVQSDGPQNIGVAARLEAYRRLVAADQLDAAWALMAQTMKEGTSLGQLVNQFKMLRGATPDGVMVLLNKQLLAQGFDPVSPIETIRIRRLAEESIKSNARWKEAERQWKAAPTEENFKTVEVLQREAIAADTVLREKLRRYEPRTLGGTLSTLFKGNLIAPISQARNIVGNSVNLAIRGQMRNVATVVDAIDAALRSRPRTRASVGLRGTKEAIKAIGRTLPESLEVLRRGGSAEDLAKAEARVGLRPLVALRDAITADVMGPKRNGKTPLAQRALMALEASPFGMHAAAQLRLLGAADKPFRAAAQARLITEALKVQDLNRRSRIAQLRRDTSAEAAIERQALERMKIYTAQNVAKAVKFPELFLDADTVKRIDHEAAVAVFQNKNELTSRLSRALTDISPMTRFMVDTVIPFTTTPANVIGEWMSYAPPLALFNLGRHAVKGDARMAAQAAGKLVVGTIAFAAGQWLYHKGLVSPTLDQSDEQQKARILSGQSMPSGRLNVTGLQRALNGGPGGWQAGDQTVDILSAGGVMGAVFQTVADVNRRLEREPEASSQAQLAAEFGLNYLQLSAGYGVQQSFLNGTATLLEALMSPQKTESWTATYLDSLSAIALPNTMVAISRATRENKPELRGDSLDERLNNQIKNRIAGTQRLFGSRGAEADLPLKRDLWGRPIPETPTGSNPYLANFLVVTRAQRIPTDPLALHLYGLWRRTADLGAIPTPPDSNFSIGTRHFEPLTRAQVDALQEIVGEERHRIAERVIENPRFYLASPGEQIAALKTIWSFGNQIGSLKFYKEHSDELKERREKAGFVPQ